MIFEIIKILAEQVASHTDQSVELGNIANIDAPGSSLSGKTIITLINYDEEGAMRNIPNNRVVGDRTLHQQPTVSLNLFLLFSCTKGNYEESLKDLTKVIEFFQARRTFTQSNTVFRRQNNDFVNIDNFKFHIDLHSISFEDLNYIWGSLGGKQYPSALYKLRIVHVAENNVINQSGIIKETKATANHSIKYGNNEPV